MSIVLARDIAELSGTGIVNLKPEVQQWQNIHREMVSPFPASSFDRLSRSKTSDYVSVSKITPDTDFMLSKAKNRSYGGAIFLRFSSRRAKIRFSAHLLLRHFSGCASK